MKLYEIKIHDDTNGADVIGKLKFNPDSITHIITPTKFYTGYDGKERKIVTIFISNFKYRVNIDDLNTILKGHMYK